MSPLTDRQVKAWIGDSVHAEAEMMATDLLRCRKALRKIEAACDDLRLSHEFVRQVASLTVTKALNTRKAKKR